MEREPLVFVGTCDLAGLVRGKGFPLADLAVRLKKGIGLTHSNIMMSAFGPILDTPFGTAGDLMLVPDAATNVEVEFADSAAERFYLGDILTTDGEHWECCPRHFLRRALAALRCLPISVIDPGNGSSIHYAGGLRITEDATDPLGTTPGGRLNAARNVYVADSANWLWLPSKGPTLTLMAAARRVAANVAADLAAAYRQLQ